MNHKYHKRIFAVIIVIALLLTSLSASIGEKQIKVVFRDIKVSLDGSVLVLKDAKGNILEPFLYNGTNYLPVRAVAEALGKDVGWDGLTSTILINSPGTSKDMTYPGTVDSQEPSFSLSKLGISEVMVDAYKLEQGNTVITSDLSFNDGQLLIEPSGFLDYNTAYTLKLFLKDGTRNMVRFTTGSLPLLTLGYSRKIIFVPAMPEEGFNYPYYLVLPTKTNVDKNAGKPNYLFVETHNTGKVSDDLDFHINEALMIAEGNSASIADQLGLPRIVPILVRPMSKLGQDYIYTHALTRPSIYLEQLKEKVGTYPEVFEVMDRVDLQVDNMIEHANTYLEANGWDMEDKIFMWGFSASGDFTNRFAFLHPDRVKAACFGGFPILPMAKAGGYDLIYPFGTYDYKTITGKDFDIEAYNSVAKLGYIGSVDFNNPILNDDLFTQVEKDIINGILAVQEYPARWEKMSALYKESGGEAQASVYIGAAHEVFYKGMSRDYLNFYMANRVSDGPVYVQPSDPSTTLTEIYSDDIVEVEIEPFSYDKTTINEAFWSGTLPKNVSDDFINFFKTTEGIVFRSNMMFISISEWDSTKNSAQMDERLNQVGGNLTLKASGYKDIRIELSGSMTQGSGGGQLYFVNIINPDDVVSGIAYKLVDTTGHWIIPEDISVVRNH